MPGPGEVADSERSRSVADWQIWKIPLRASCFLLTIDAIAALVLVGAFVLVPVRLDDLRDFGVVAALGLLAAEMTRQVERRRRRFSDTPHVNFSSVWTLAGALVLPAALAGVLAIVLYAHLWLRSWRGVTGMHAYRIVFSTSNVILTCQVVAWCAHQFRLFPIGQRSELLGAIGLAAIIGIYFAVNSLVVGIAIALIRAEMSIRRLLGPLNENVLEIATLSLGAMAAVLLDWHPSLILLIFLPLYALHRTVLIRQFEHAATTDSKTGLLNASSWRALADAELVRARRHGTKFGVFMIDLDHFRLVNDKFGHLGGDAALRSVGDVLRQEIRGDDLCGRFGGEEFVVVVAGISGDDLEPIAERLRARIFEVGRAHGLSASIGAALYPDAGEDLEDVLLAADNALYAAKDAGRNRVRVFGVA